MNASIEFGICAIADTHNASWHRAWRISKIGRSVLVAFNLLISVGMTPIPGTERQNLQKQLHLLDTHSFWRDYSAMSTDCTPSRPGRLTRPFASFLRCFQRPLDQWCDQTNKWWTRAVVSTSTLGSCSTVECKLRPTATRPCWWLALLALATRCHCSSWRKKVLECTTVCGSDNQQVNLVLAACKWRKWR